MMHVFLNAVAASAGGGLTYVRNVVPHLAARHDVRTTVLLSHLAEELAGFPNVSVIEQENGVSPGLRFWREQWSTPKLIKQSGANVVISTGNFALWDSPIPQILLSRNALYSSREFQRDLRARGDYRLWFDTDIKALLARASIARADCTVAPSRAFADELHRWTGLPIRTIHHGFDPEKFLSNDKSLPRDIQSRLEECRGAVRLLFVSHYNYYRNFSTLIRALPLLKERLAPRKVKVMFTCSFTPVGNPGSYRAESEAALLAELGVADDVVQFGAVPYDLLHHLYAGCDIYVSTAYAESFAHPLVEAMACGLPVVASDLSVHREICQDAAAYFAPFSSQELAQNVCTLAKSPDLLREMKVKALKRAKDFSWSRHVTELLDLASTLVQNRTRSELPVSHSEPR